MGNSREDLAIQVPRLVIGGATSGVGKTTFVAGLIGALRRRGLKVAPFKVGPDYIDPSFHTKMAGRPCRNLDSWMVPSGSLVELFARSTASADVAIVEGVMGLYDGRHGTDDEGSTAQVAKLLNAPVALMVNVGETSRSAGATVLGFRQFDPDLRLAGVILNRVGSPTHRQWVQEAIEEKAKVPVLGALPRRPDLGLPERHLGLVPTGESAPDDAFFARLIDQVEADVDVVGLLNIARSAETINLPTATLFPATPVGPIVRIGLALDRAFTFYYEDNLDLLRAWGAELVPFSPLSDPKLPDDLDGLYIGGGFPELFAADLAANQALLSEIRGAIDAGLPTYAECGGLMYLSEGIVDFEGRRYPLVGALPTWSGMTKRQLTMGYRTATARTDNILLGRGEMVRGHEFHWSEISTPVPADWAAYTFAERPGALEGFARGRILASYLHVHFASRPDLARRFVAACQEQHFRLGRIPSAGVLEDRDQSPTNVETSPRLVRPHSREETYSPPSPIPLPDLESGVGETPSILAGEKNGRPTSYPVSLNLVGKTSVVVGGGLVAERKVLSLLATGARILVVSPDLTPELVRLQTKGQIQHIPREYRNGDLAGAFLVLVATGDRVVNEAAVAEASCLGVLVNVADDPVNCDFALPAILRQGGLKVAVSTNGRSPAVASYVRDELARFLKPEYATLLDIAAEVRAELQGKGERVPVEVWHRSLSELLGLIRKGDLPAARSQFAASLKREKEARRTGMVSLVGAGPATPGLITARGLECLRQADVVIYDHLVDDRLLSEAPTHAERIYAGKLANRHTLRQPEINVLLVARAREGKRVVRLKGGDPFVFGRGGEEAQALAAAGIPFEVVPGVSSAIAVPAYAGIPLTHRAYASSFAVVTGHEDPNKSPSKLDWERLATAVDTLVLLMGAQNLSYVVDQLLRHGRRPDTPIALIRWGTWPEQETLVGTLSDIVEVSAAKQFGPPAIGVIGEVVRLREALRWYDKDREATTNP